MANLPTGGLTPRSNSKEVLPLHGRFWPTGRIRICLGSDGQQGWRFSFDSASHVRVGQSRDHLWSVMLTNEQRKHLSGLIASYDPVLWEDMQ